MANVSYCIILGSIALFLEKLIFLVALTYFVGKNWLMIDWFISKETLFTFFRKMIIYSPKSYEI